MESIALAYEPLFRHLQANAGQPVAGLTALARQCGKDPSNLQRDLPKLHAAGLLELDSGGKLPAAITAKAALFLTAMDVADGRLHILDDFAGVRHAEIAPHPLNPRKDFSSAAAEEALEELTCDLIATGYVIQNLLIRPPVEDDPPMPEGVRFWIVAGERRWRGSGRAIERGAWSPDMLLPAQVKLMSLGDHLRLALAENIQRQDLNPIEKAEVFEQLISTGQETAISLAKRLNKTDRYIDRHRQLLKCPPVIQLQLRERKISIEGALEHVQKAKAKPETEAAPGESSWATQRSARIREACGKLKALQLLVLVEIADKLLRDPAAERERYTTCLNSYPDPMHAHSALMETGCGFLSSNGWYGVQLSDVVLEWLREQGYVRDEALFGRDAVDIERARILAGRQPKPGDRYVTPWLNPAAAKVGDAGGQPSKRMFQDDLARQMDEVRAEEAAEPEPPAAPLFAQTAEEKAAADAQAKRAAEDRLDELAVSVQGTALKDLFAFNAGRQDPHWNDLEPAEIAREAVAAMADGSWWGVALLAALRCTAGHKAVGVLHAAMASFAQGDGSETLVGLRTGDVVNTGGATNYRLIGRAKNRRFGGLEAQPILHGKDHGKPRTIWLWDIRNVIQAGAAPTEEAA